jgi:hypothetical protein
MISTALRNLIRAVGMIASFLSANWSTLFVLVDGAGGSMFGYWLAEMADTPTTQRMFQALGLPVSVFYFIAVISGTVAGITTAVTWIRPLPPTNRTQNTER